MLCVVLDHAIVFPLINILYAIVALFFSRVILTHDFLFISSEDVRDLSFSVVIDMRGSTWNMVKPILKVLQEFFAGHVHAAYIVKPDKFWQKQMTSIGSQKYKFEVGRIG